MSGVFRKAALTLLTEQCYDEYFVNFNFFHSACFAATISKGLGLVIIVGSILVKFPQIIKIIKNRSGEGISLVSVSFDLAAISIFASYSYVKKFPFSAWGDASFLLLQTVSIAFLVLYFSGQKVKAFGYLLCFLGILTVLAELTPVDILWTLQGINIPILLSGKLSQAFVTYKNGHTGQLSAVTVFSLFLGSVARIFTSIQETGDFMSVLTFVFSTCGNAILVFQMLYYWNVVPAKKVD